MCQSHCVWLKESAQRIQDSNCRVPIASNRLTSIKTLFIQTLVESIKGHISVDSVVNCSTNRARNKTFVEDSYQKLVKVTLWPEGQRFAFLECMVGKEGSSDAEAPLANTLVKKKKQGKIICRDICEKQLCLFLLLASIIHWYWFCWVNSKDIQKWVNVRGKIINAKIKIKQFLKLFLNYLFYCFVICNIKLF